MSSIEALESASTLDLISELRRRYRILSLPKRSCTIVGPPLSGVGTQSREVERHWGVCAISRKDIFAAKDQNIDQIINYISQELSTFRCRRGFVLSNFPESEAEALDRVLHKSHHTSVDYKVFMLSPPSGTDEDRRSSVQALQLRGGRTESDSPQDGFLRKAESTNTSQSQQHNYNVNGTFHMSALNEWWQSKEKGLQLYYGSRLNKINALSSKEDVYSQIDRILHSTVSHETEHR